MHPFVNCVEFDPFGERLAHCGMVECELNVERHDIEGQGDALFEWRWWAIKDISFFYLFFYLFFLSFYVFFFGRISLRDSVSGFNF